MRMNAYMDSTDERIEGQIYGRRVSMDDQIEGQILG